MTRRREASLVTVAADDAELLERAIGCRRVKGRVHFSKASRSAESSLPTRSWRWLFRYCHSIHQLTEALEHLMQEDAAAAGRRLGQSGSRECRREGDARRRQRNISGQRTSRRLRNFAEADRLLHPNLSRAWRPRRRI